MKKTVYWILLSFIWIFAIACIYIGFFTILYSSFLGPTGDIDYVDFDEKQKTVANIQTAIIAFWGLIVILSAGLMAIYSPRFLRRKLKIKSER